MHRFANVRAAILAATAAAGLSSCCSGYEDPVESQVVSIDPAAKEWSDAYARCLADDFDCLELCLRTIEPAILAERGEPLFDECRVESEAGAIRIFTTYGWPEGCVSGRRPRGHVAAASPAGDPIAIWLAAAATLEAGSVLAFAELAADLRRLGAPAALVSRCLTAAADEVRHAAIMASLACRRGASPRAPERVATEPATLADVALHNATEGCVGETYGAALAVWQSHHAEDPELRAAMASIAGDEIEHAQLSRDLDAWLLPRLPAAERAGIESARRTAIETLTTARREHEPWTRCLGLPDPVTAERLAVALLA